MGLFNKCRIRVLWPPLYVPLPIAGNWVGVGIIAIAILVFIALAVII